MLPCCDACAAIRAGTHRLVPIKHRTMADRLRALAPGESVIRPFGPYEGADAAQRNARSIADHVARDSGWRFRTRRVEGGTRIERVG